VHGSNRINGLPGRIRPWDTNSDSRPRWRSLSRRSGWHLGDRGGVRPHPRHPPRPLRADAPGAAPPRSVRRTCLRSQRGEVALIGNRPGG
jgi:hypothetical protein